MRAAADRDLRLVALLDGDAAAVGEREVEGGGGRRHVEGDVVVGGGERHPVGPDLVRHVAVRGDAVGAGHDELHAAPRHQRRRRGVADERMGYPAPPELPGRQAGALQQRPRLVHVDVDALALPVGESDHAEGGAHASRGERPGVAVREDAHAVLDAGGAQLGDVPVPGDVLVVERAGDGEERARRGFGARGLVQPAERPGEVDRGGPRGGEESPRLVDALERSGPPSGREDHAVGGREPDGRCAPDRHVADGLRDLPRRPAVEPALLAREEPLVQEPEGAALDVASPLKRCE